MDNKMPGETPELRWKQLLAQADSWNRGQVGVQRIRLPWLHVIVGDPDEIRKGVAEGGPFGVRHPEAAHQAPTVYRVIANLWPPPKERKPWESPYPDYSNFITARLQYSQIAKLEPLTGEPDIVPEDSIPEFIRLALDLERDWMVSLHHLIDFLVERDVLRPDYVSTEPLIDPNHYLVVLRESPSQSRSIEIINPVLRKALDRGDVQPAPLDVNVVVDDVGQRYYHFSALMPLAELVHNLLPKWTIGLFRDSQPRGAATARSHRFGTRKSDFAESWAAIRNYLMQYTGDPVCNVCLLRRRNGKWATRCPSCRKKWGGSRLPRGRAAILSFLSTE